VVPQQRAQRQFCLPHPRGNSNDNSGVFVRFRNPQTSVLPGTPGPDVPGNPATVAVDTGYEIQIDEEARGDTRKGEPDGFFFNRTGAVYKVKDLGTAPGQQSYANNQRLAPAAWHRYEIIVTDRTYEVLLNGGRPPGSPSIQPTRTNASAAGRRARTRIRASSAFRCTPAMSPSRTSASKRSPRPWIAVG